MVAQRQAGLTSSFFMLVSESVPPAFRPVVLLMDGHSSHFCPDMIRMAAKEKK